MNKKIVGIIVCMLFIVVAIPQIVFFESVKAGINNGLVGYWNFNDGTATDSSGNGNHGTIYDATYLPNGGPDGSGCLSFDGIDDRITIPDSDSLSFGDDPFSITAWGYMDNAQYFTMFSKGSYTYREYHLTVNSNKKYTILLFDNTNQNYIRTDSVDSIEAYEGEWVFFSMVYSGNGQANGLDLYINGNIISTVDGGYGTYISMHNHPYGAIIGRNWPDSPGFLDGILDELRIYNRALIPDEIWDLYGGDNNPPNPPGNPNPYSGATGVDVNAELSWSCSDPDGNPLTYDVYFGTNSNPSLVSSNQTGNTYKPATMSYLAPYYWRIIAWDNHEESTSSPLWSFTTTDQPNNPPVTPSRPSGPAAGHSGVYIEFSSSSGDSDLDQIKYGWDWNGNDKVDEWTGFIDPNSTCVRSHKWNTPGNYNIKVKVKDSKGAVSDWSDVKNVNIIVLNQPPYTPSDPSPSHGAIGVDINTVLSWNCIDPNGDPVTYDIYFGIHSNPPLVISEYTNIIYILDTMLGNTCYYWRIVAWDYYGESSASPIWNFTTLSIDNLHPEVNIFSPEENDIVTGFVNIYGAASDPDGNETLTLVEVRIDDKSWQNATGREFWNYSWNADDETEGIHKIRARSFDGEFYSNDFVVNVTVQHVISEVVIFDFNGVFGLSAVIKNIGTASLYNVSWSIDVEADFGLILSGSNTNGMINVIGVNETEIIQSKNLRGIGFITITVQAADAEKQATAFLLGPLVLRVNEI